jgi:phage-related protein
LSTFGVGGHELLVSNRQHFTIFKGISFVSNAFERIAGIVAARKTIVSAVKTSPLAAKIIPATVEEVIAAFAGTSAIAKTTRAAAETISSAVAEVVAAFQTSRESSRQFLARQK